MTDYYVSADGDDASSGGAARPWRTLDRMNAAFARAEVGQGDRVWLRRGDTFTGAVVQPDTLDPSRPGVLQIRAYGDGAKPTVSGYQGLGSWVQHDADTWRHRIAGDDVGLLKVDGVLHGQRRARIRELADQWDFFVSGSNIYVRSEANPGSLAGSVQCSLDQDGTNVRSATLTRDICFMGHGGHGANAPGRGGSTRAVILNCEFAEIGGCALDGYGSLDVRYGNGIQGWVGTRDLHIEQNTIRDCYDAAMTLQGVEEPGAHSIERVTFRRNVAYRNSQSFEFWYRGAGAGFVDIACDLNVCLFSGHGWGAEVRPEQQTRVNLLTFAWDVAAEIAMRRNIYYDPAGAHRYGESAPAGLLGQGNVIAHRSEVPIDLEYESDASTMVIQSKSTGSDADVAQSLEWAAILQADKRHRHIPTPVGWASV